MRSKQPAPLGTVLREDARERTDWLAITVVEAERDKALAELDDYKQGAETEAHAGDEARAALSEALAALREADDALRRARDGLDFGLGHARRLEGEEHPIPSMPLSKQMDRYLKDARKDHAEIRSALSNQEKP